MKERFVGRFLEALDHQVDVEKFKISNADGTLAATESNLHLWYSQVANRDVKDSNRFGENKGESEKMFSLWLYYWMIDHESLATCDLESRLYIDGMTYLAERVFELPYNELKLRFTDEEIYGDGFGDKGVLNICRDGVDLRRAEQEPTNRVMYEGLGMWNLVQLLQTLKIGESAMLISPPDPDDPNMGGYNMIYLYEKTDEQNVRMGVITDSVNNIEYWRNKASNFSRYRNDFSQYDHNQFVAHPFITKQSLVEIKSTILHVDDKYVPDWALDKLRKVIPSVRKALYEGNVKRAEELFNAFKIATTSKLLNKDKDVNMERLVDDVEYFLAISGWYIHNGGDKYLNKKTGCSLDRINLGDRDLFNNQWDRFTQFDMSSVGIDKPEDESYSFDIKGICVGSCFDEVLEDGTKVKHERDLGPCRLCRECDEKAKRSSQID